MSAESKESALRQLWNSLRAVEIYLQKGLVEQINSSPAFGGGDMHPVLDGYLVLNDARPFLPADVAGFCDWMYSLLERRLNRILGVLRAQAEGRMPYKDALLEFNRELSAAFSEFQTNLRDLERLIRESHDELDEKPDALAEEILASLRGLKEAVEGSAMSDSAVREYLADSAELHIDEKLRRATSTWEQRLGRGVARALFKRYGIDGLVSRGAASLEELLLDED